jgi:hypothetical protein
MSVVSAARFEVGAVLLFPGCETQGPAERVVKKIYRGIRKAKDAINPARLAERAGRAVDQAVNP